ncbi:hypothetical protein HHK36_020122 [Tetracentron sinense]|uniref:Reticulon-like protein n=1 Tax=Tetracentron sinense TaxID=13715 RepID=A0A834YTI4_TETSI|nr:hypothetical protein HHK36_020122 [Tetracentron sinense]
MAVERLSTSPAPRPMSRKDTAILGLDGPEASLVREERYRKMGGCATKPKVLKAEDNTVLELAPASLEKNDLSGRSRNSGNEVEVLQARCHYSQAEVDGCIFNLNGDAYVKGSLANCLDYVSKNRSIGREIRVKILGSFGAVADVFLWRNKKISAGALGGATAMWVLFELLESHLLLKFSCFCAFRFPLFLLPGFRCQTDPSKCLVPSFTHPVLVIAVLLKIITRRRFSTIQWEALALLLIGISVNQMRSLPEGTSALGLPIATGAYMSGPALVVMAFAEMDPFPSSSANVTVPSLASVFNEYALKSQFETSIYLQIMGSASSPRNTLIREETKMVRLVE